MEINEKGIQYKHTNSYSTLNSLTKNTKNVWFVCHGLGYLSRYFIRYFNELDPQENYIIAPQAASKYYQGNDFKHVGASWLTKENTQQETINVLNYLQSVYDAEQIPENIRFIAFGYSQGVSVICRWVAKYQIKCDLLVLYSGGIPDELTKVDFNFLKDQRTQIKHVFGTKDQYINEERLKKELNRANHLFESQSEFIPFEGIHEVKKEIIAKLIE